MPTASHRRHLVFSDLFSGVAFSGAVTINVVGVFSVFRISVFSVFSGFAFRSGVTINVWRTDGQAGGRAGPD